MLKMALAFEVKLKRRMDGRKNIDEAVKKEAYILV